MKARNIVPYATLLGFLMLNPAAKASEQPKDQNNNKEKKVGIYLIVNNSSLNPKEYNDEIRKISLGDVYKSANGSGFGLEARISKKLWLDFEFSKNYQKVDSIKEDISGNRSVYGYNKLGLNYIDPSLLYRIPITKNTSLDLGAGIASTLIQIETSNGEKSEKSNTLTFGTKFSASLCQKIKNFFVKATIAKRTSKADNFDASCWEKSFGVGVYFK